MNRDWRVVRRGGDPDPRYRGQLRQYRVVRTVDDEHGGGVEYYRARGGAVSCYATREAAQAVAEVLNGG